MRLALAAAALQIGSAAGSPELEQILERLSREAEAFHENAPRILATERLIHRGRMSRPRMRLSPGVNPKFNAMGYLEREVVSEYGFAYLKESPGAIHEFRQVVSVDGKKVKDSEKARETLTMSIKSDDDRARKRMLQDFEKQAGITGAATDFGQLILLFRSPLLDRYQFKVLRKDLAPRGSEGVIVLSYRQKDKREGARVFHGRRMLTIPAAGEIWVLESGYLPVRITIVIPSSEDMTQVIHTGEVDYEPGRQGVLLPSSVHYTARDAEFVRVENLATYSDYRTFQAESDIKFQVEEVKPE